MTFVHQPLGAAGIKPLAWLFNAHTVEASGEPYSVNATFHDTNAPFAVASGPSQRFVADLSNLGASLGSTPVGQSGLTLHPHREDQVDAWAHVTLYPMYYGRQAAMAAPGETLTLNPARSTP
jgi:acyl-homoserine lactone acylase PvdQ